MVKILVHIFIKAHCRISRTISTVIVREIGKNQRKTHFDADILKTVFTTRTMWRLFTLLPGYFDANWFSRSLLWRRLFWSRPFWSRSFMRPFILTPVLFRPGSLNNNIAFQTLFHSILLLNILLQNRCCLYSCNLAVDCLLSITIRKAVFR